MSDFTELRQTLVARLEELGHRVHDLEDDRREPLNADFAEQATQMEAEEVSAELEHNALAEANQIRAAIDRIDGGDYGTCAACGEAISPARLKALPYAVECINCAQAHDG